MASLGYIVRFCITSLPQNKQTNKKQKKKEFLSLFFFFLLVLEFELSASRLLGRPLPLEPSACCVFCVEFFNFLPGLELNHYPADLCLPNS
jgi:hypothetical protein